MSIKLKWVQFCLSQSLSPGVAGHAQEIHIADAWDLYWALEAEEQALM
jgi:hypothetical protein